MKKFFIFFIIFFFIPIFLITAEGKKEKPIMQVKMDEIQEIPVLSIDANGTITNTAKPIYGTGKLEPISLESFKNWKKEIKFSETFVSNPEDNKTIIFIIGINKKNEVSYIKESEINKEIKGNSIYITLVKIPLDIVSIKIVILEKTIYNIIPANLIYKNREEIGLQKVKNEEENIEYEYIPPLFIGH